MCKLTTLQIGEKSAEIRHRNNKFWSHVQEIRRSNSDRFSDNDWTGSCDDMKSTSGYLFSLGSGYFSWNSKKQEVVAQSTAEVEYIAVVATNQALWIRKILANLKFNKKDGTIINVDNQAVIEISNNPVFHISR